MVTTQASSLRTRIISVSSLAKKKRRSDSIGLPIPSKTFGQLEFIPRGPYLGYTPFLPTALSGGTIPWPCGRVARRMRTPERIPWPIDQFGVALKFRIQRTAGLSLVHLSGFDFWGPIFEPKHGGPPQSVRSSPVRVFEATDLRQYLRRGPGAEGAAI